MVKFGDVAPVKFELSGYYVPVHPDRSGERFIVEFQIIPVTPAPVPGPLFGARARSRLDAHRSSSEWAHARV